MSGALEQDERTYKYVKFKNKYLLWIISALLLQLLNILVFFNIFFGNVE